eukprot:scaffold3199_cov165-Amphora_coffeaeformis.AAC.6
MKGDPSLVLSFFVCTQISRLGARRRPGFPRFTALGKLPKLSPNASSPRPSERSFLIKSTPRRTRPIVERVQ